jgi:hypothetical protein
MPDGLIKPLLLGGPAACVLIAAIVSYSRIEKSRGRLQGGAFSVLAMLLAAIGILLVVIVAIFNRPLGNMH